MVVVWWLVLFRFGVYVDLVTIDLFGDFVCGLGCLCFGRSLLLLVCGYGMDDGCLC